MLLSILGEWCLFARPCHTPKNLVLQNRYLVQPSSQVWLKDMTNLDSQPSDSKAARGWRGGHTNIIGHDTS
jgi:hypothetical protein